MSRETIVLCTVGYLVFGGLIAYALNDEFDIGGPIDPGAGGSPRFPKWLTLPLVALLWPLAILLLIFAFLSWVNRGSH